MGKYVRYGRILLCLYISYCIHKQIIVSGIWTERKRCFLTASNSRKNKTWTSDTNAVQERTMTLYIKYHHMNSRNSEIRIKSLKVCICLQFVTLLYFPAACLSALVSHTLSTGRSGWIWPPSNHIYFEVCLQYYLKMAILDHFQKSDLEKWAEERYRIRTWADTHPNLF